MSKGPDFICIGAEKAGTTWLYDNIRHHPEIWLPPPPFKELHYFDDRIPNKSLQHIGRFNHGNLVRRYSPIIRDPRWSTFRWLWRFNHHKNDSMQWYRSLFSAEGKLSGDITPTYSTLDERGVEYVRRVVKENCKVILILRDPVSRFWSSIKMLYRYNNRDIRNEDASSITKELERPYMALKSDYPRIINIWRMYFPNNQFGIYFYDDLVLDSDAFLKSILQFLKLGNSDWKSPALNKRSNTDKNLIDMPNDIKAAVSNFYLPDLEVLSDLIEGHARSWLESARAMSSDSSPT